MILKNGGHRKYIEQELQADVKILQDRGVATVKPGHSTSRSRQPPTLSNFQDFPINKPIIVFIKMFGDFEDSREESHISGPINEKVGLERIHEAIPAPVSKRTNIEHEGGRASRIRIRNRRRIYLDNNPDYFSNPDLELAGTYFFRFSPRRSTPSSSPLLG